MILLKFSGFEVCRQWRREGVAGRGWGPARKCPYLVNIYNFNKNN